MEERVWYLLFCVGLLYAIACELDADYAFRQKLMEQPVQTGQSYTEGGRGR